jgi:hypothetical protein
MNGKHGVHALYAVLSLLLILLVVPAVSASLLGVSKVSMDYTNVLRGGYAEDTIVVSTGSSNNIAVYLEAQGDIKDWVSFKPTQVPLVMSANNPASIQFVVQPPIDTQVGFYEGTVMIRTGNLANQSGNMGTNVEVAFEIKIRVNVTDTQTLTCTAGGFDLRDAEIGTPLEFSATVSNNGNVRIRPDFKFNIYDQDQKTLITTLSYASQTDILPTLTGQISVRLNNTLKEGQYWAEASSPLCNSTSLLTFSILEKGGISDIGDFVRLQNQPWALTGDIVPINASFRNRGSRIVSAQFKGIVTKDGKIIKVITSDKLDVAPGELIQLQSYFTPTVFGQYRLSGRIYYNNKITFEKSSILNVNPGSNNAFNLWNTYKYYIILLLLIIIILILLILIIRRRRKAKKAGVK